MRTAVNEEKRSSKIDAEPQDTILLLAMSAGVMVPLKYGMTIFYRIDLL